MRTKKTEKKERKKKRRGPSKNLTKIFDSNSIQNKKKTNKQKRKEWFTMTELFLFRISVLWMSLWLDLSQLWFCLAQPFFVFAFLFSLFPCFADVRDSQQQYWKEKLWDGFSFKSTKIYNFPLGDSNQISNHIVFLLRFSFYFHSELFHDIFSKQSNEIIIYVFNESNFMHFY